jgi:hypothetical protein
MDSRRKTRKLRGGFFAPPPLVMVKFAQNAIKLAPAALFSTIRLFSNGKKVKKQRSKRRISKKSKGKMHK